MALTYPQLVNQIQTYANQNDTNFLGMIPYFVNMGLERIYREGKDIGLETIQAPQIRMTVGTSVIAKPVDWSQTVSFSYQTDPNNLINSTILFERSYEFCLPFISLSAPPQFYCDKGGTPYDSFLVVPAPDKAYYCSLIYLQKPLQLLFDADGNPTEASIGTLNASFLMTKFPALIFYASFLECIAYIKQDERLPTFEAFYKRALDTMNQESQQRYVDRTAQRDKD